MKTKIVTFTVQEIEGFWWVMLGKIQCHNAWHCSRERAQESADHCNAFLDSGDPNDHTPMFPDFDVVMERADQFEFSPRTEF